MWLWRGFQSTNQICEFLDVLGKYADTAKIVNSDKLTAYNYIVYYWQENGTTKS